MIKGYSSIKNLCDRIGTYPEAIRRTLMSHEFKVRNKGSRLFLHNSYVPLFIKIHELRIRSGIAPEFLKKMNKELINKLIEL